MNFKEEIKAIKAQMEALQQQNQALKDRAANAEKKEANHLIDAILKVIHHGDRLESDFSNLLDQMENDELLIDLGEANNPSSDILGFTFTNIVFKSAIKHFIDKSPMEDKARFKDVILNVVKSPLVKVLMTTNPVSWLVSKVVDKVADLTESIKGKHGHRILTTKKAIAQNQIDAFTQEMEAYFPFYEALLDASEEYEIRVEELKEDNIRLEALVKDYYNGFLKILELDPTEANSPLLRQVQDRFTPTMVDGVADYRSILENGKNQQAYQIALKFPDNRQRILEVMAEYKNILSDYLEANVEALNLAKSLSENTTGLEKLENRIKERRTALSKRVSRVMKNVPK